MSTEEILFRFIAALIYGVACFFFGYGVACFFFGIAWERMKRDS